MHFSSKERQIKTQTEHIPCSVCASLFIIAGADSLFCRATTILVSHSLDQVREMCTKILWLHKGRQIDFGTDVSDICDRYQAFLDGKLKP